MQRAWFQYIVGSFLAGLVIQSFPVSVLAQSQGSETAPTVLQPIVTMATRSERSLADLPVSVTVLEREQIQTAPAHATDDVLRTVPSLNLPLSSTIVQHPTANLVGIRGLGLPVPPEQLRQDSLYAERQLLTRTGAVVIGEQHC